MPSVAIADALPEQASPSSAGAATAAVRRTMVDRQLRPFDVTDLPLLEVFLKTPRELFLPAALESLAYSDSPMSAKGADETRWVPPPLVLARFLQAAELRENLRVLDVGGGAGYAAALAARLCAKIVVLESDAKFADEARANLARAGARNTTVVAGPLDAGVPAESPFDVILVHGAVEANLDRLLAQLAPNGRLLTYRRPSAANGVRAYRFERAEGHDAGSRPLFDAAAPPLAAFAKAASFQF
ncbi:MAG TPA: methyltransferase domain-containing protein [Methylocystis sp.]|nr:methyltransferase domain-containing protein [Methylocystis sp.]